MVAESRFGRSDNAYIEIGSLPTALLLGSYELSPSQMHSSLVPESLRIEQGSHVCCSTHKNLETAIVRQIGNHILTSIFGLSRSTSRVTTTTDRAICLVRALSSR